MDRKNSIDVMRIIGALAVVALHTMTAPVAAYKGELSASLLYNLKSIEILMGWVVPVFLMITGYCLANKKECTYKYCFSHVWKYVIVLFTIGLGFALLKEIFAARESGEALFSFPMLGRALLSVVNGRLWEHMWFVYAIIGVYLVMPVIHLFLQTGTKNVCILTGLLFLFTILVPEINSRLGLTIDVDFPFVGYLFYVCFGGLVRKCEIKKWFFFATLALGAACAVFMVLVHTDVGRYDDKSPFVALLAMAVFLLVDKWNVKENKVVRELAACTWGVYLLHPVFLNVGTKLFKIDLLSHLPYLKLFAAWIVVFLLTFGLTWVLRRLPFFKKIL